MNIKSTRNIVIALLVLVLGGCSGGTGGTGAGGGSTSAVSTGVMAKGSVIVNGVRFEDTVANIIIDDTPKTAADLRDGMVVQVVGTVNADGVNGTAQRVEAQIEVRGLVSSVNASANPQSFVVLGQMVLIDDLTVLNGVTAPINNSLVGTPVEVHGLRDTTGQIRATRIEANTAQMGDSTVDEIRGVVSDRADNTDNIFSVGAQLVNATSATVFPTDATYANGSVIEVHCTRPCVNGIGEFVASRIEVESAEDSAFQPGSGQRFEAEGLISGFAFGSSNFSVAGIPVTTTSSTRFVGGISTDLANNIKVEAEGAWNGTRLVASKIEFKRSVIRLQGATANGAGQTFDLQIANATYVVKIELDSLTNGTLPANGLACVEVRGQRKSPASPLVVTAGEIKTSCGNSGRHFIQAPVEAKSSTAITLLGLTPIDISNPTDAVKWKDINDQPILLLATFLNMVTPASSGPPAVAGTLVKVIFDDAPSTLVKQVELED